MADGREKKTQTGTNDASISLQGKRQNNTPEEKSEFQESRERKKSHPEDLEGPKHDEDIRSGTHTDQ
jgi:hypothetical protein